MSETPRTDIKLDTPTVPKHISEVILAEFGRQLAIAVREARKKAFEEAADIARKSEHVIHEGGCLTTQDRIINALLQAAEKEGV